jgi:hypothetical protein
MACDENNERYEDRLLSGQLLIRPEKVEEAWRMGSAGKKKSRLIFSDFQPLRGKSEIF